MQLCMLWTIYKGHPPKEGKGS